MANMGTSPAIAGNDHWSDEEMFSDADSSDGSESSSSSSCDQSRGRTEQGTYRKQTAKIVRNAHERAHMQRFLQREDVLEVLQNAYVLREAQPLPEGLVCHVRASETPEQQIRPARTITRAASCHARRRVSSADSTGLPRRRADGEPPQSWVRRRRSGRPASRSRQMRRNPAVKRLLSEAKKKRANSVCRPLMLRTHSRRQGLRYGDTSAGCQAGDGEATASMRLAVREEAQNFQIPYAHVLESMEDRLCFRKPQRSHTLDESEFREISTMD